MPPRNREGGRRSEAEVRIPVWLCSSWPLRWAADFSVKEKDEASLSDRFRQDSLDAFIPRLAGIEGFFILTVNFALVSQSLNRSPIVFAEPN